MNISYHSGRTWLIVAAVAVLVALAGGILALWLWLRPRPV